METPRLALRTLVVAFLITAYALLQGALLALAFATIPAKSAR